MNMENKKPKVSVIVTTYNREKYLKETIQSILNQTFTDFELIVVDNFSNYNFFEVIESFNDSRIKPFQNQNNGIISVNRNFGLKQVLGEYVAFCDDDDLWLPDKLRLQITEAKKNTIVYTRRFIVNADSSILREETLKPYKHQSHIYWKNNITLSSVLLFMNDDVVFDENKSLIGVEDYALWVKLINSGYSFSLVDKTLIKYRISSNNYSKKNRIRNPIQRIGILCSQYSLKEDIKDKHVFILSIIKDMLLYIYYNLLNKI